MTSYLRSIDNINRYEYCCN